MTAVAWGEPVRRPRRRTRRDEIFEWVCRYADEMDGCIVLQPQHPLYLRTS
jgi:hypothetical protein